MTWADAFKLGRVSNLPTVWTNTLAGVVLAGGAVIDSRTLPLLIAFSLFYVGGMYLNDAFDAEIDAVERPERPIPSGRAKRSTVFVAGFAMLATGMVIILGIGFGVAGGTGIWPVLGGAGLASAIVFYDWHHKTNPLSPLVMGMCRMLLYITAGLCFVAPVPELLLIGAGLLLSYLIGLTYVAKQENLSRVENLWPLLFLAAPVVYGATRMLAQPIAALFLLMLVGWILVALRYIRRRQPGDIPRAVVSLIAGISLLDGLLIAIGGEAPLALLACLGFLLTLVLQRYVPGT